MALLTAHGVTERVRHVRHGGAGWWVTGLLLIVVAVHVRTFGHGLYRDDYILVRPWGFRETIDTFWGPFDPSGLNDAYYRPFASLSFALEWPVWGTTSWGYHVTNLVLHAGACVGVLLVLRRVRVPMWCAFIGAAYFAVVPANVATVVYIAERTDAMVAICTVTALLCVHRFQRTRDRWPLVAVSVSLVLGLLAKEVAVAIVPMAALYWWYLRVEALDHERRLSQAHDAPPGDDAPRRHGIVEHWRGEARLVADALVERASRRDWLRLVIPPTIVSGVYVVYRTTVLPSGSLDDRFAETQNPVSSLLGGLDSTVRGVPWEIPTLAFVPLVLAVAVAVVIGPTSRTWRVVLLGGGLMIAGVLPLTFSGGVEPRLLYVAQIGMAIVLAGIAAIYAEAIAARPARQHAGLAVAACLLGFVVAGTTLVSTVRAQDLFEEGSEKQLNADLSIYTEEHLHRYIDPSYLAAMQARLVAAGLIPVGG